MMTDKEARIKINTKYIVLSVVVLTILTLSVSYSAFFDVKVQENVQSFKAGTLNVEITTTSQIKNELTITKNTSLPQTQKTEAPDSGYAKINLINSGSLDAVFVVTLKSEANTNALDLSRINIGVYNENTGDWVAYGEKYYTPISGLTQNEEKEYPILKDNITNGKTNSYRVYVWLSESAEITDISKNVKLSLKVKSTPKDGQNNDNGIGNVTLSS